MNPYKYCGQEIHVYILIEFLYGLPADTTANMDVSAKRPSRRARNISKLAYTCDFRDDGSDFGKEELKDVSPEGTPPRRGPGRRKRKRIPSMRIRLLGRNEGTNSPIFSAETLDVSSVVFSSCKCLIIVHIQLSVVIGNHVRGNHLKLMCVCVYVMYV